MCVIGQKQSVAWGLLWELNAYTFDHLLCPGLAGEEDNPSDSNYVKDDGDPLLKQTAQE